MTRARLAAAIDREQAGFMRTTARYVGNFLALALLLLTIWAVLEFIPG